MKPTQLTAGSGNCYGQLSAEPCAPPVVINKPALRSPGHMEKMMAADIDLMTKRRAIAFRNVWSGREAAHYRISL